MKSHELNNKVHGSCPFPVVTKMADTTLSTLSASFRKMAVVVVLHYIISDSKLKDSSVLLRKLSSLYGYENLLL